MTLQLKRLFEILLGLFLVSGRVRMIISIDRYE
jgi:hypothetical protein